MTSSRSLVVTAILLASGLCRPGLASAEPPAQERKKSLAVLSRIAASFDVRMDDKRKATREAEPAMRWTNTISHATDAALFVWMCDGRPVAAGTAFVTDGTVAGLEFQSLALEPFQVRSGGKPIWEPREPGLKFQRMTKAPLPAETGRQRLSQMKTLARRFRAEAIKGPPAYQENDVRQLRLLSQPILQYHDAQKPEKEGALFAFAMDTDCDVLLLIENRVRDGTAGWEYALARSNPFVLKAWCDETLVWSQARVETAADPTLPFFLAGPFPVKEE